MDIRRKTSSSRFNINMFKIINGLTDVKFEVFFDFGTNYRTPGYARKLKKSRSTETCVSTFHKAAWNADRSSDENYSVSLSVCQTRAL